MVPISSDRFCCFFSFLNSLPFHQIHQPNYALAVHKQKRKSRKKAGFPYYGIAVNRLYSYRHITVNEVFTVCIIY